MALPVVIKHFFSVTMKPALLPLLALLLCAVPGASANSAASAGTYTDRDGKAHAWHVDENNTLIWDDAPYIPFGAMIIPRYLYRTTDANFALDRQMLETARQHGIEDMYLNSVWSRPVEHTQRLLDLFETLGFRYGLQLASTSQTFEPGYLISADQGLVHSETPGKVEFKPKAAETLKDDETLQAWYAIIGTVSGSLIKTGRIEGGKEGFAVEIKNRHPGGVDVKFVVRSGTKRWIMENPAHRTEFLKQLKPGPNFRFLIDPIANEYGPPRNFLPTSDEWRAAFVAWMQERYETVPALISAWGLPPASLNTFAEAAQLVPLVSGEAKSSWWNAGYVVNDSTGKTFAVEMSRSRMWLDMCEVREVFLRRRVASVTAHFRSVFDVPIVAKRHGQSSRLWVNERGTRGIDGLGMEAYGTGEELAYFNGAATWGEVAQNPQPVWSLVTESNPIHWHDKHIVFRNRQQLHDDMNRLLEMGAKGVFMFGIGLQAGVGDNNWTVFDLQHDPRQEEWLATFGRAARADTRWLAHKPTMAFLYPPQPKDARAFLSSALPDYGLTGDWQGSVGIAKFGRNHWAVPVSDPEGLPNVIHSATLMDSPILIWEKNRLEKTVPAAQRALVENRLNPIPVPADGGWADRFGEAPVDPVKITIREIAPGVEAVTWTDAAGQTTVRLQATGPKAVTVRVNRGAVSGANAGKLLIRQPGAPAEAAAEPGRFPLTATLPPLALTQRAFRLENRGIGRTRVDFKRAVGPAPDSLEIAGSGLDDIAVDVVKE